MYYTTFPAESGEAPNNLTYLYEYSYLDKKCKQLYIRLSRIGFATK